MMEITGKRILVVGMARSGLAALRLLRGQGAETVATDSNPTDAVRTELESIGVPLVSGDDALHGCDLVVISPGVPIDSPLVLQAKARGIPVIGEVELASYYLRGRAVGITGSNGKTTTTSLIGHILRESGIPCQVGGNIGTPPTAMVDSSRDGQWNVLELSSFQLETIEHFHADIALCLNVTPDHLDRHHTMEAYAAAKGRLFDTQHADGTAVLNADDATYVSYAEHAKARVVWFSSSRAVMPGVSLNGDRIVCDGQTVMLAGEIPLPGRHNLENVMAAVAATYTAGASLPRIAAAVKTFPGVEHRLEFTRELDGVRYYNDSKATNVDATLKAIDSFPGNLWIILGGKDKDSDYTVLRDPLRQKARAALLIGAAANKIESQLAGALPLSQCGTLEAAVRHAQSHASPGDIVLLAPACASFDQFNNFEHRGKVFKEIVRGLASVQPSSR